MKRFHGSVSIAHIHFFQRVNGHQRSPPQLQAITARHLFKMGNGRVNDHEFIPNPFTRKAPIKPPSPLFCELAHV